MLHNSQILHGPLGNGTAVTIQMELTDTFPRLHSYV